MTENSSRHNYLVILLELILFLLILCFLVEISKVFFSTMVFSVGLKMRVFIASVLSGFMFYAFIVDLNDLYKKIQGFFFKSSVFAYLVPFFLLIAGLGYFILPKLINVKFSESLFLFVGGFILTSHLSFIAYELKETSFSGFINYLFFFSLLYLANLLFFGMYLKAAFSFNLFEVLVEGIKNGADLIQTLIGQIVG